MEDGQTGGEHGLTQTAGKNEEGNKFFFLFPLLTFFSYLVFLPEISHSFSLTHSPLRNLMPLIIFQFSDIYLLFFEHYPWACSRGGECNGYGYPILILLVQPHPI